MHSISCSACFFSVVLSEKTYYCKNSVNYVHALRCFINEKTYYCKNSVSYVHALRCFKNSKYFVKIVIMVIEILKRKTIRKKRRDDNTAGNELVYGAVDLSRNISLISNWDFCHKDTIDTIGYDLNQRKNKVWSTWNGFPQQTFTRSNLTIEALEKDVKYVQS